MPDGSRPLSHRDLFRGVRVIWRATPREAEADGPPPAGATLIDGLNPGGTAGNWDAVLARVRARPGLLLARWAADGDAATLAGAVVAGCDGIVLAGCTGAAALQRLSARLAVLEADAGRPDGSTALVAEMGAQGLLALPGLAGSSPRLAAVTWDPNALAAACGGTSDAFAGGPAGGAIRPWLVIAAVAAGVPAYDVIPDLGNTPLAAQAEASRHLGFAGAITAVAAHCGALARGFGEVPVSP